MLSILLVTLGTWRSVDSYSRRQKIKITLGKRKASLQICPCWSMPKKRYDVWRSSIYIAYVSINLALPSLREVGLH